MAQKLNKAPLIATLAVGAFLHLSNLTAPYHEECHKYSANLQGIGARVIDWNHCAIDEITPYNLVAGYYGETIAGMIIYFVALAYFRPWPTGGFRSLWQAAGIPLGFATTAWLTPLISETVDFSLLPHLTDAMRLDFFLTPGWVVGLGWVLLYALRLRSE